MGRAREKGRGREGDILFFQLLLSSIPRPDAIRDASKGENHFQHKCTNGSGSSDHQPQSNVPLAITIVVSGIKPEEVDGDSCHDAEREQTVEDGDLGDFQQCTHLLMLA